jgi:diguanylate cyclase (GGDEF)-like protein/PAS domain S-box-containing protein
MNKEHEGHRYGSDSDPLEDSLRETLSSIRNNIFPSETPSQTFFRQSVDPNFILHNSSGVFVSVNDAFISTYGYERPKLLDGTIRIIDLMNDQQDVLKSSNSSDELPDNRNLEIEAIDRAGDTFPAHLSISYESVQGHTVIYGTLREISEQKEKEQTLRDQLNETVQANNRILALTEKMKQVPILTSNLLNKKYEKEIYRRAREKLCERTGLNYKNVRFYLFDESKEYLRSPFTDDSDTGRIDVESDHPAVQVATGQKKIKRVEDNVFILPLRGEDKNYGVLEITLYPSERKLMEGSQSAWSGYQETLVTLSDLLGLILQNRRLYEKVRRESIHDELTGLFNRRHFNRKLKQEVYRSKRYQNALSLMIIDIDDFKEVNDRYGHQEGDRILKQLARVFEKNCRQSDIVCRYGGDEFGIILPETNGDGAERKARNVLNTLRDTDFTVRTQDGSQRSIQVSVSIGISFLPVSYDEQLEQETADDHDHNELLKKADKCMYRAKMSEDRELISFDPPGNKTTSS